MRTWRRHKHFAPGRQLNLQLEEVQPVLEATSLARAGKPTSRASSSRRHINGDGSIPGLGDEKATEKIEATFLDRSCGGTEELRQAQH
jgi:hypothetical protein